MIDIKDFKHSSVCYFGGEFKPENMSRHSIGKEGAPAYFRIDVCHTCLKEIITEGLKRLTEEERAEIIEEYMPQQSIKEQEEQKEQIENGQYAEGEEHKAEVKGASEAKISYRDELIAKAKELGIKGKLATFSNKKLENEIRKLSGK